MTDVVYGGSNVGDATSSGFGRVLGDAREDPGA